MQNVPLGFVLTLVNAIAEGDDRRDDPRACRGRGPQPGRLRRHLAGAGRLRRSAHRLISNHPSSPPQRNRHAKLQSQQIARQDVDHHRADVRNRPAHRAQARRARQRHAGGPRPEQAHRGRSRDQRAAPGSRGIGGLRLLRHPERAARGRADRRARSSDRRSAQQRGHHADPRRSNRTGVGPRLHDQPPSDHLP